LVITNSFKLCYYFQIVTQKLKRKILQLLKIKLKNCLVLYQFSLVSKFFYCFYNCWFINFIIYQLEFVLFKNRFPRHMLRELWIICFFVVIYDIIIIIRPTIIFIIFFYFYLYYNDWYFIIIIIFII
jgi:hypothetical protein